MAARKVSADERGFALGLAVVSLVILTGLAGWAVVLGLFSARAGQNGVALAHAFAAAEEGALVETARGSWRAYRMLPPGGAAPFTGLALAGTGEYRGAVTRLGGGFFLVHAEGFDSRMRARQRVGVLVWLQPLALAVGAAVEATGLIEIRDRSRVVGTDSPPVGERCSQPGADVAGVRVPRGESDRVSVVNCIDGECVRGTPDVAEMPNGDSGLQGAAIQILEQFATLELWRGQVHVGPASGGGQCLTDQPTNWGDPGDRSDCGAHIPVVYAHGDLVVTGGMGQPLLIVDGDLELAGDTYLEGLILVFGRFVAHESAEVRGAVVVSNPSLRPSVIARDAAIRYSGCAVKRALSAAGVPTLLPERSWVQLN